MSTLKLEEVKLKYIAKINPSKSEVGNLNNLDVSFLPMEKILGPGEVDLSITKPIKDVYSGYTYFKEDDIVIAKVTPCFENGNISIMKNLVNGIGFGTTELHVVRVNKEICNNKFIFYLLQLEKFKDEAISNMYGVAGLKRVPTEFLENYKFGIPTLDIQNKIVAFLDYKLNAINNLIKQKQDLIDLFEEKCQSMITEAVTKGLNPNVKMKDSGVEWIGEIPFQWKVSKLKYFSHRIGDGLHGTPIYDDNGEIYFINGYNLGLRDIRLTDSTNKLSLAEFKKYNQVIGSNTILISLNGTIGKLSLYNEEPIMISKSAGFINIKECINREYVYYFLKSNIVKSFYEQSFAGTTINNLSLETLRNTPLLVPSIAEQKEIVNYLNNLELEFKKVLSDLHLQIEKLKEYRQSLIYEAVTGKIDVRDMELA